MKVIDKIKQSTPKEVAKMIFEEFLNSPCTDGTKRRCQYDGHDCYECVHRWLEGEI